MSQPCAAMGFGCRTRSNLSLGPNAERDPCGQTGGSLSAFGGDGGNRTRVRKIGFASAYRLSSSIGSHGPGLEEQGVRFASHSGPRARLKRVSWPYTPHPGHLSPIPALAGRSLGRRAPSGGRARPQAGLGRQRKSSVVGAIGNCVSRGFIEIGASRPAARNQPPPSKPVIPSHSL